MICHDRLIANVKAENEPCRKIFERLGFRVISDKPELICYVKDQGPS
jgi:RimJ/RimL family protein N-acetyltransferase